MALILYIVLWAYSVLAGRITEPVMDGVLRLVKLCFIYAVATTVAYNTYVTGPLFEDLPNWLAKAISGSGAPSVGAAFDSFFNRGGYLATKIFNSATLTDPGPYVTGAVVWVVTALTAALGFGIVMLAKVALAVLVALGPIFIACLVFEASRMFFYGWLKQGVNYLILFALIITVFQIILALVEGQWGNIDGQADPTAAGLLFIALCLLGAIFFLQTPNIAAGIAGVPPPASVTSPTRRGARSAGNPRRPPALAEGHVAEAAAPSAPPPAPATATLADDTFPSSLRRPARVAYTDPDGLRVRPGGLFDHQHVQAQVLRRP
ncbi:type IV secretion system protein [Phenylobacterium sp. J426]|uniref:type IV secretion system protein n=1 Tax=Phenylobacterium sp. J426 TaxID=2898439 RepID=UPI002151FCAE|nr:type IV secretion system protein [Phenylobacterium sp. J426]MCR5876833.1 type IV secretion system protein [Phenylobacterium sp. J426]